MWARQKLGSGSKSSEQGLRPEYGQHITMASQSTPHTDTTGPGSGRPPPAGRRSMIGVRRSSAHGTRASRLVAMMKLLLPALALAMVGLIVAWPQLLPDHSQFRIGDARITASDVDGLRMENPRYVGVDENKQPYQLTARVARQDGGDSNLVQLDSPKADLMIRGAQWVALQAGNGIYDKRGHTIQLTHGVTVFHDAGYSFTSATARVDLQAGSAASDDPIQGQGKAGEVSGEGFRIEDSGARILFTGKARLLLYSDRVGDVN